MFATVRREFSHLVILCAFKHKTNSVLWRYATYQLLAQETGNGTAVFKRLCGYIHFLDITNSLSPWKALQTSGVSGQTMYVESNIDARSCNQFCGGKAMSFTYYERVFVELGTQHAQRIRHTVISGLHSSTVLFHIS